MEEYSQDKWDLGWASINFDTKSVWTNDIAYWKKYRDLRELVFPKEANIMKIFMIFIIHGSLYKTINDLS